MIRIALLTAVVILLAPKAEAQGRGHIDSCLVSATGVG
jgi:hypothetical protein